VRAQQTNETWEKFKSCMRTKVLLLRLLVSGDSEQRTERKGKRESLRRRKEPLSGQTDRRNTAESEQKKATILPQEQERKQQRRAQTLASRYIWRVRQTHLA
jgi:hypothetical protein